MEANLNVVTREIKKQEEQRATAIMLGACSSDNDIERTETPVTAMFNQSLDNPENMP